MQITRKTGFRAFEKAIKLKPEEVIAIIKKSGITGRGGANFPTGLKWELTRKCPYGEKVLICNADEGEPGTFKDKFIIKNNPDIIVEGIATAAYAIGAKKAYIYLRGEYDYLKKMLEGIIKRHHNRLAKISLNLEVFIGAGAYICGDETAILNSIQGTRGEPRQKPPYPAEKGLYDRPTCINNVETLANIPLIIDGRWKDLRLFSLSGNVEKPGIYELPLGVKVKELIEKGNPKKEIKALFFGCAGGCVPYEPGMKLDIDTINKKGAMLGCCTIVAVDKEHKIPEMCKNIAEFFVHESCGKCVPCREGNLQVLKLLEKAARSGLDKKELILLEELADFINTTSFCGLGQASNNHTKTALKYFRKEFEKK